MSEQYDIREDEEQNVKLQEIIDLLVAAGYFRARIKGLSSFDKVVGGMIWCMDSCNFDVNVDLLFKENSTIGQKIALTEKIVTVLPKMECPHHIEPHQIQGLDFIHVFPVIQWLVKRSVKVREERREFIRAHAVAEYDKHYGENVSNEVLLANINRITQDVYRQKRMFKRKDNVPEDEELRVESTLMEYGMLCSSSADGTKSGALTADDFFAEALEVEENIPSKFMGNIMTSQVQKIAQVSEQLAKLELNLGDSGVEIMRRQREMMADRREELERQKAQLEGELEEEAARLARTREAIHQLETTERGLQTGDSFRTYEKLQSLLLLEDSLKRQEQQFREHCKMELDRLQQLAQEVAERNSTQESDVMVREGEEERERVHNLRLVIAKKNRSIALLQRQLDEMPGRAELAQYQRRFLELYSQVAQKHEETKQFYTLYNTLDDTKLYLTKELSLLNSVLDNYSEAMSNAIDKEEFMTQFESIVGAIKQNKQKVERRRSEERARRDRLSKQLLDLVEQGRSYVAIVRQLRIECKKNEALLAHCRGQS